MTPELPYTENHPAGSAGEAAARLYAWLAGRSDVMVLRPGQGAGASENGDIDLLAKDPAAIERELDRVMGRPELRVARTYVIQRYHGWGQVDVLPDLEWNGVPYADVGEVFERAVRDSEGVLRPAAGHDAFISWMTSLLWGGFFKHKYAGVITGAVSSDPGLLRSALDVAFGVSWGRELFKLAEEGRAEESARWTRPLRRALVVAGLRRDGGRAVHGWVSHWFLELRHHLRPAMPMLAVLGPDGSGKSTVIQEVIARLADRRISTLYCHWRPRLVGRGAEAGAGPVTDPHGKPPRGRVASVLKLGLLAADWFIGDLWKLRHARAKAKVVLFDRYYDDLLVDPRRYRYGAPLRWAYRVFCLLPQMKRVFVLWAEPEVIGARKQEVPEAELRRQLDAYRNHAIALGDQARLVHVDRPVAEIADEIMESISQSLREHARL
jgi:thymidylate kinase